MVTQESAARIARNWAPDGATILEAEIREIELGWYFPLQFQVPTAGCNGVIINKHDGSIFALGSAYPAERDLLMYDRGFQAAHADLVILEIRDHAATVEALLKLRPRVTELSYEHGTVWRTARALSQAEIENQLTTLPAIFGDLAVYFRFETLAQVQDADSFKFKLLKRSRS